VRLRLGSATHESNAGGSGRVPRPLIRIQRRRPAQSILDRVLAGVRDADASDRDLAFVHSHDLSACGGEPIAD
jgi:hypothetical protein